MVKIKKIVKKTFFISFIVFFFSVLDYNNLSLRGALATKQSHEQDNNYEIASPASGRLAMTKESYTNNCSTENKQYIIKKVFDGDTILVRDETSEMRPEKRTIYKIRLLGIDAFEHEQNIYGIKGKDFLSMLILNKNVCVETDVQKNDVYGRTLGYVFINGLSVNEELLKNGYAILYDFPPNIKYLSRLKKAQIYGRENMLGIWEKQSFILETPAQWRHEHPYKKRK